jgi:hypothetical protein
MWIELRTLNPPELVVSTIRLGQRAINVALRLHTSALGLIHLMAGMWNVAHLQHRTRYHSSSLSIQAQLHPQVKGTWLKTCLERLCFNHTLVLPILTQGILAPLVSEG